MNTPIYNKLRELESEKRIPFHMPGHKRADFGAFFGVEKMDIKRIDEELLPQRDAAFKLVTDDLKQYCSELEKELYDLNEYEFVLTDLNDNEINIVSENEIFIEQEILKIDISHQKHEYNVDISEKNYHYINDYPLNINISQLDENVYEEMNIECAIIGNIAA